MCVYVCVCVCACVCVTRERENEKEGLLSVFCSLCSLLSPLISLFLVIALGPFLFVTYREKGCVFVCTCVRVFMW